MDIQITPVIPESIKTLSVSDLSDSCMMFLPSSNSSSSASTPVQSTFGRLDLLEAKFKVYEEELKVTKEGLKVTKEDLKVTKEDLKVTKEVLKVHGEKLKVLQEGVMDPLLLRALLENCRGIVVDLFKAPRDRYKTSHADLRQQWHDARYTAEDITSKLTPRLPIGAVNLLVGLGGGTETRSTSSGNEAAHPLAWTREQMEEAISNAPEKVHPDYRTNLWALLAFALKYDDSKAV